MQARYYDPAIGRFLSTDPLAVKDGDNFSFARYVYASNNPILNIDPDGRDDQQPSVIYKVEQPPLLPTNSVFHVAAKAIAADVLFVQGAATGNQAQQSVAVEAMQEITGNGAANEAIAGLLLTTKGGTREVATGTDTPGMSMGSSGGPGAGKQFSNAVKDAAEANAGGNCVFCGVKTTRERGPTQRNTDHADPKSRGGNNTLQNAQNTCRTCNQQKGTMTTQEYLTIRVNEM